MPRKKKTVKKKRINKKKISRRLRAYNAAIRRIAEEDDITLKEAEKRYPNAIVEVIIRRPSVTTHRHFIEISPSKFREVPPGEIRETEAFGPIRSAGYISKYRKAKQYWELVNILAEEADVSIKEMRRRLKRKVESGDTIDSIIYETAKTEFRRLARSSKAERSRYMGRPRKGIPWIRRAR